RLDRTRGAIAADETVRDIGVISIDRIIKLIESASTVVWCGEVGDTSVESFMHGNARIALALATHPDKKTIIASSRLVTFLEKWDGLGGESFPCRYSSCTMLLNLIAGKILPGLVSLMDEPTKTSYTKGKA
ncbi:phosphoglycerate kinase, partial [Candidatus Saccharibacteria bacterium 32-49-10]